MSNKTGQGIIKNLIWSIKEINKFNKKYMYLMILDSVLTGISPVISLILTQQIINEVQLGNVGFSYIVKLLIILNSFELIQEIGFNYIKLLLDNYELKYDTNMQAKILKKISILDSKDFEDSSTYDLITRTQYDLDTGVLGNIKTFFSIISLSIGTLSYLIIVIRYNIIVLFIILFIPIIRYYFEKRYNLLEYKIIKKNTEVNRRASYISYLLTNSEHFKEIKMFNLFEFFINKYKDLKSIFISDSIKLNNIRALTYSVLMISEGVIDFFVMLNMIKLTFTGELLIGEFILYSNSISGIKKNMTNLFSQISFVYKNSSVIDQVKLFFNLPMENVNKDGIKIDEIKTIKLENISYKYDTKNMYTLRDINLTVKRGEITVLMGYNGSGKSTLMKIIMGIYNDYEGNLYVNGINLKLINKNSYREKVGVLFQDYIKYEASISENILYGNLNKMSISNKVDSLLKKVGLNEFLAQENQILGYQFNKGRQISIGQWQKLALARTITKEADIYIFDEPNSSLDLVSESIILNVILSEVNNKIGIIIMHRFNEIVVKANQIVVLKDGHVEEIGTHNELLKNKNIYYDLYSIQNNLGY